MRSATLCGDAHLNPAPITENLSAHLLIKLRVEDPVATSIAFTVAPRRFAPAANASTTGSTLDEKVCSSYWSNGPSMSPPGRVICLAILFVALHFTNVAHAATKVHPKVSG